MPQPKLIHPVNITFELMDRDNSFFDQHAREPVRQLVRKGAAPNTGDQVTIKGQASFYFAGAKLEYTEFLREGVLDRIVGYVALRFKDMKKQGLLTVNPTTGKFTDIGIKKGDRIVTSGGLFATVLNVKDDRVVATIADGVKVEIAKSSISGVAEKG